MSSSLIWAFLDRDQPGSGRVILAILLSIVICMLIGCGCLGRRRHGGDIEQLYRKEAIAVVGVGWLLCGVLGALPYIFSGVLGPYYSSWYDIWCSAFFESVSGFTTTGASIFPFPEELPRAILFWRSLTHWLGGMGIIVLFVAVLGQTGSGAKFLVSSEVPGPLSESIRPRIRQTAVLLWNLHRYFHGRGYLSDATGHESFPVSVSHIRDHGYRWFQHAQWQYRSIPQYRIRDYHYYLYVAGGYEL